MNTKKKILVVDDSPGNRMLFKYNLDGYFDVEFANNGLSALEKFSQNQYDLILMDINMPQLDGIETTKKIRASEKELKTPILAVTSNVQREQKEICLNAGMDDFITKPIHAKLLIERISYYINK